MRFWEGVALGWRQLRTRCVCPRGPIMLLVWILCGGAVVGITPPFSNSPPTPRFWPLFLKLSYISIFSVCVLARPIFFILVAWKGKRRSRDTSVECFVEWIGNSSFIFWCVGRRVRLQRCGIVDGRAGWVAEIGCAHTSLISLFWHVLIFD